MNKVILLLVLLCGEIFSQSNDYPWSGYKCSDYPEDNYGFYKGQCTSWACWKVNQSQDDTPLPNQSPTFHNKILGPNLSHAKFWATRLGAAGYFVSNIPTQGAIAQWNESDITGGYGHVGFVEWVNENGTAKISEYNTDGNCGFFTTKHTSAPRYIRYSRFELVELNIPNNEILRNNSNKITCQIKNNHSEDITLNVRCGIYKHNSNGSYKFIGDFIEKPVTFKGNGTSYIEFERLTSISAPVGDYKIWIETNIQGQPYYVLTHKPNSSSTASVTLKDGSNTTNTPPSTSSAASYSFSIGTYTYLMKVNSISLSHLTKYNKDYFSNRFFNLGPKRSTNFKMFSGPASLTIGGKVNNDVLFLGHEIEKNSNTLIGLFYDARIKKPIDWCYIIFDSSNQIKVRVRTDFNSQGGVSSILIK